MLNKIPWQNSKMNMIFGVVKLKRASLSTLLFLSGGGWG
jgi:hypothetical protein